MISWVVAGRGEVGRNSGGDDLAAEVDEHVEGGWFGLDRYQGADLRRSAVSR